jgi:dTDP-4-dehydrorhamnose 3,5-epimerase
MQIEKTNIDGVSIIRVDKFPDERGMFMELYSEEKYLAHQLMGKSIQINFSHSEKSVLRGLHYQIEHSQGKILQVVSGTIFDVGLDLRRDSLTFGKYFSIELNSKDSLQVFFPPGIAHGFCVLSDYADIIYQCDQYYNPSDEYGVLWNDPDLEIDWPINNPIISNKDQQYETLVNIPIDKLPVIKT